MSGLPEQDVAQVRSWCDRRVPEAVRDQVRVECEQAPRHLTIVERRPPRRGNTEAAWMSLPVAQLRYTATTGTWALYYRDRNLRFHRYDHAPPSAAVSLLLDEISRDPTGIFWG
ncbi:DUF3024 domain-containing protein [Micromonospora sp. NPDC049275]|uniref:DUF3024 domain-containing protein n=1 Tax=Micromonospora sp. NPDC049275 TaxID=3364268 RepID=UPI00371D94E5